VLEPGAIVGARDSCQRNTPGAKRPVTINDDKKAVVDAMGADLGELFLALSDELTWMFIRWSQFQKLYSSGQARLDVINRSAPFFFWVIQQALWEDTLLALSRLGGPVKTMGKENLSLRRLSALIDDDALRTRTQDRMNRLDTLLKSAIDWRNRRLAHRDLALALERASVPPLAEVNLQNVSDALDEMAAMLNHVSSHFTRSSTAYKHASLIHDADELLFVLRDGLRREELRQTKLEAGEYDPADWNDDDPSL
jgi:hypothetical protein